MFEFKEMDKQMIHFPPLAEFAAHKNGQCGKLAGDQSHA
jgi:hypothetical protein